MSDADERNSPPADVQAELSERDRAEITTQHYNPAGGPPQGRDLPYLNSPPNRRPGNPPLFPPLLTPRAAGGGPTQGRAQVGGNVAAQHGPLQQQPVGQREKNRSLADGGVEHVNISSLPDV